MSASLKNRKYRLLTLRAFAYFAGKPRCIADRALAFPKGRDVGVGIFAAILTVSPKCETLAARRVAATDGGAWSQRYRR